MAHIETRHTLQSTGGPWWMTHAPSPDISFSEKESPARIRRRARIDAARLLLEGSDGLSKSVRL